METVKELVNTLATYLTDIKILEYLRVNHQPLTDILQMRNLLLVVGDVCLTAF